MSIRDKLEKDLKSKTQQVLEDRIEREKKRLEKAKAAKKAAEKKTSTNLRKMENHGKFTVAGALVKLAGQAKKDYDEAKAKRGKPEKIEELRRVFELYKGIFITAIDDATANDDYKRTSVMLVLEDALGPDEIPEELRGAFEEGVDEAIAKPAEDPPTAEEPVASTPPKQVKEGGLPFE